MRARTLALVVALCAPAAAARAAGRRSVAVLEHRAGVEAAQGIAERLAARLAKSASLAVVDPQEARRRDPHVDAELARCAGQAACVARIGATLEVDEVLLVAVSQLGDVVLNLQHIDVEERGVAGQLSEVLAPEGEPPDGKLDDWLHALFPPEVFKRWGFIAVSANVDGARVQINGQERGLTPLAAKVRVLAARGYRVTVEKSGYAPFAARIDVVPDASVEVRAELQAREGGVPWYKRWYVWAIVGGGLAAGAGIGVGLWLGTRPDQMHDSGYVVLPGN
jgi:hypothetical protein